MSIDAGRPGPASYNREESILPLGGFLGLMDHCGMGTHHLSRGVSLPHHLPDENAVPLPDLLPGLRVLRLHETVQGTLFALAPDAAPFLGARMQAEDTGTFCLTH